MTLTNRNTYILIFAALLCSIIARAQDLSSSLIINNIGVAQGLSQSTVRDVRIDANGFVWAGTFDGLNRYDGERFVTYKPEFGKSNTIDDAQIHNMVIDAANFMWVRKYNESFSLYSPRHDNFIPIIDKNGKVISLPQEKSFALPDSTILFYGKYHGAYYFRTHATDSAPQCIWQDSLLYTKAVLYNGTLWTGGSELVCIEPDGSERRTYVAGLNGTMSDFAIADGIAVVVDSSNIIRRVDLASKTTFPHIVPEDSTLHFSKVEVILGGTVALNTNEGLKLLDVNSGEFLSLSTYGCEVLEGVVGEFIYDQEGTTCYYDRRGNVYIFDRATSKLHTIPIMDAETANAVDSPRICIKKDTKREGIFWISSYGGGLVYYDAKTCIAEKITSKDAYVPQFMMCVEEDSHGDIWAGSEFFGMLHIAPKHYKSRTIRIGSEEFSYLNNVRVVYEARDYKVWVGIRNGDLYIFDSELKTQLHKIDNINPTAIIEDKQGRVWVGTYGNGIYVFDSQSYQQLAHFTHNDAVASSLVCDNVYRFVIDKDGRVWIAAFGGGLDMVEQTNLERAKFRHFFEVNVRRKARLRDAYQDSDGKIWIATSEGLICFEPDKLIKDANNYVIYQFDPDDPDGIGNNDVRVITEDLNGQLWIGTGGGGINKLTFDVGHAKFQKFTVNDGLPSNVISSIVCTADSLMWIGTENGLSRYCTRHNTFVNMNVADHKFGNMFGGHSFCVRKNGKILYGTTDGVIEFDPNADAHPTHRRLPVVTEIWLDGKKCAFDENSEIIDAAPTYATRVVIPESYNTLSFNFAALDFSDETFYTHRVRGYDENWSTPRKNGYCKLNNLTPGTYYLDIKNKGDEDSKCRTVQIVVERSFLRSPLMMIVYVILIVVLITISVLFFRPMRDRLDHRYYIAESERYKKMFLDNLNSQIRSPMGIVERSIGTIKDKIDEVPASLKSQVFVLSSNIEKLSRMINALIEFRDSRTLVTLNLEITNVAPFLNDTIKYFNSTLKSKHIHLNLVVAGGWRELMDRDKIRRVVTSLVQNAISRMPKGGEITISATENYRKECIIKVQDTGDPIPEDKRNLIFADFFNSTSDASFVSLATAHEFVKSHHGRITYTPSETGGSIFTITLPSDYSHYPDANIVADNLDFYEEKPPVRIDEFKFENDIIRAKSTVDDLKPVVLIVDDKEDSRDFLVEHFGVFYNVIVANDGREAQSKIKMMLPDLIICDDRIAGTDSRDLIRKLKLNFNTSHIPIVLITNDSIGMLDSSVDCMAPNVIFLKPIIFLSLKKIVRELIIHQFTMRIDFVINNGAKMGLSESDERFFARFVEEVRTNVTRVNFGIEDMAVDLNMQRDDIHRRVLRITDVTPGEYIKLWRLDYAMRSIDEGKTTASQSMLSAGLADFAYFNKCFVRLYGASPSHFQISKRKDTI